MNKEDKAERLKDAIKIIPEKVDFWQQQADGHKKHIRDLEKSLDLARAVLPALLAKVKESQDADKTSSR